MVSVEDASRGPWLSDASYRAVQVGTLQRIATALEKSAESFDRLRSDRDYWKNEAESAWSKEEKLRRSQAALKGVITRQDDS
jgi:hypothetical protein